MYDFSRPNSVKIYFKWSYYLFCFDYIKPAFQETFIRFLIGSAIKVSIKFLKNLSYFIIIEQVLLPFLQKYLIKPIERFFS